MSKTPRVLILTRHPFLEGTDGAGAYLWSLIRYLNDQGVSVRVASLWIPAEWVQQEWMSIPKPISRVVEIRFPHVLSIGDWRWFRWGSLLARSAYWLRRIKNDGQKGTEDKIDVEKGSNNEPSWSSLANEKELKFFRQQIEKFQPDLLIANFCWLANALSYAPQNCATAVLAHDVMPEKFSNRQMGGEVYPTNLNPCTEEGETKLLNQADFVLAISARDAEIFRQRSRLNASVLEVPFAISPTKESNENKVISDRLLYVGSDGKNNSEGLHWFLNHVWPQIKVAIPTAEFHICGQVGQRVLETPEGVVSRGYVPDLGEAYASAQVVIVPLLCGSGVKIKLLEAAANGKAIVSTSVGMQGLDHLSDCVIQADDPEEFSLKVISLLENKERCMEISKAVIELIKTRHSPEVCYQEVCELAHKNDCA